MSNKYDHDEATKYPILRTVVQGRRTVYRIQCPFCEARFYAFSPSFRATGKCCPKCGAKHTADPQVAAPRIDAF